METVNLTSSQASIDPTSGWTGYVPGWTAKGHSGYWGFAWYRIRVRHQESAGQDPQKLAVWDVDDAYQLFADGKLIGAFGRFSPETPPATYWNEPEIFDVPEQRTGDAPGIVPVEHVFAFRIWCGPLLNPDGGGVHVAPVTGDDEAVRARYQTAWLQIILSYASYVAEALIYFVLAIAAFSLIFFDRSDPIYLWLAGIFLVTALCSASQCLFGWTLVANQTTVWVVIDGLFHPLIVGGWVMAWWYWFRLCRPTWVPKMVVALTILYGLSQTLGEDLFFTLIPHRVSQPIHLLSIGIRFSLLALLVLIAILGIQRHGPEGWLVLPAMVLVGIAQFQFDFLLLHIPTIWFPFGVSIMLTDLASAALSLVIFVLLLRRLQMSLHHQRLLALDLKQAQELQQVLLPESRTTLRGIQIECEYQPAREVGGDFFQIVPKNSDGSLLIVAGDVTGKGLKAGMVVALLVGAIRSTAETDAAPENVLAALNRRLLGRKDAQATCVALRIAEDGVVALANAGHLPPYLNGEPIEMEGSLPLGIIEGPEFSFMGFQLNEGDKLVLVSDGVAEATDGNGNLFGFERVQEMLHAASTAAEIATAARKFGQEDDISVIAITRTHIPQLTPARAD